MSQLGKHIGTLALSILGLESQGNRLLRMHFPRDDGPAGTVMLANSIKAREEMSRDFRFDVEVLSDDAGIPLKAMMARMVTVSLVRDDGSLRYFNGYVSEFRYVRTDGGFAFYQMRLEPWLAFSKLRNDSVSFINRSVLELTEETLAQYEQHDWKTCLFNDYPKLSCANQYNETDYNHLHRRWEAHGIHYWYEHSADGHVLWLGDDSTLAQPTDATGYGNEGGMMPFRAQSGSLEGDGLVEWQAVRRLGSGSMVLSSFNYKQPSPQHSGAYSRNLQGDVPPLEWAENTGAYGYKDSIDGERLAQQRMDAQDANTQYFEAGGNDRTAQAGRMFKLDGHFSAAAKPAAPGQEARSSIADREYLILRIDHEASNNYQAGQDATSHYKNKFTCVRKEVRWSPKRYFNSKPVVFSGVQTATVTGPDGEELYTDDLNRIKLQFHWDRRGKYNQNSSAWVRVMMPMAGGYLGQSGLPRVRQEVVVQFLEGNMDYPIVIGVVHNTANLPPWDLPGQQALAGLRSSELGNAQRGNHVLLDDTPGKIQAQLKSDHLHSLLALGHISRINDHLGRKDERGEGWELRTDGHGALRAARGMLVTTEARPDAASHIKDLNETARRLATAGELQKTLANQAVEHKAQEGEGQQNSIASALDAQADAIKGSGGDDFPELSAAHLVLASPAGVETTTAQSTHIASGEHTALTAGRSVSLAAGDSLFASIGHTFRLFVRKAGMKLIAAAGKVTVAAQTDEVEIIANKVLNLISEADWVNLRGKQGVRLHGSNCMIEISDKVQVFTSSPTLFHGNLETLAPKNRPQPAPEEPTKPVGGQLHQTVQAHAAGAHYAHVPYTLYKGSAKIEDGITDEHGRILIEHRDGDGQYQVVLGPGESFALAVAPRFADKDDEQRLSNLGRRALDDATDGRKYH